MANVSSFFYQFGFSGIVAFCLVAFVAVTSLLIWQSKRQGWRVVAKTYGFLLTIGLGAHLLFSSELENRPVLNPTQVASRSDGIVEGEEKKIVTKEANSLGIISLNQSDSSDKLLNLEARLSKQGKSSPILEKILPSAKINLEKIPGAAIVKHDWFHQLKYYLLAGVILAILLYSFRVHPEWFTFKKIFPMWLFGSDWIRPERSTENELGSSDFANLKQIKRWLNKENKFDTTLPVGDLRGSGGILVKNGNLVIPIGERNRNILIVAKTGSGKTTKLILPIIYNDCICQNRSTIIIDSKAEMWSKCSAMTQKLNPKKKLFLFNPLDKYRSYSWNILAKIQDDTDCKLIANSVIMATDEPSAKQDSPFFRNNALQVLNALMVGLLDDPNDRLSMPRIHEIINHGMLNLCDWLEAHPKSIRTTRSFVDLARSGSQNADTIMSELSMRIQAWDLTTIRATTFFDEIDIQSIVNDPTLFIVELRESELKMLRPLANVIVVELLRYLTKYAEECPGQTLPRPVGLIIDEFASALGRLPDIHIKLNTLRSRNVSIVAAIQSIGQLKGNYGEDWESVLSGFSTKIFMPSLDFTDSEWASKESGTMTVRYQTSSRGANRKITENFANRNMGTNEQIQQRQVLTPGEVGRPTDNQQTFFMPETPVFQGHLVPYYKIPEMKDFFSKLSSPEHEVRLRTEPIYIEEKLPEAVIKKEGAAASSAQLTEEQIRSALEEVKIKQLDWENTTGDAKTWWDAFEEENKERLALVLKVCQEISSRGATITDFFLAYVYSNTDNIQATLSYLDYTMQVKSTAKASAA
jgi:type IV secretory pathway TraG/TraD family ATPase VirD4